MKYVFREDEPVRLKNKDKANPQVIGNALERIQQKHGGELRPRDVEEEARDKKHPLHKHFEWNDKIGGLQWRLVQARAMIRLITTPSKETRSGVSRVFLSADEGDGVSYRHRTEVLGSLDLQLIVLKRAERDLEAFTERYHELQDICSMVQEARVELRKRRSKMEERPQA